jgi:hypothetical protein
METEFNEEQGWDKELTKGVLMLEISNFLSQQRLLFEMKCLDNEVSNVITHPEYLKFHAYKQFSLDELSSLNKTPGLNGALCSAIERGFIVGYWLAWQRFANQGTITPPEPLEQSHSQSDTIG